MRTRWPGGHRVLAFLRGPGAALRAGSAATGRRRRVVALPLAGRAYAGFKRGGNLAPAHTVGKATFAEFLARRAALSPGEDGAARR
ncbi:hypothetical protein [Streptomyces sp. H34-S4]|uniref:hypothetical protein n=1 Tax=Streptomyces sp. H34-S4 TaxID=2996463 RepID=UPI003B6393B7